MPSDELNINKPSDFAETIKKEALMDFFIINV
jgi:hypothetical protein